MNLHPVRTASFAMLAVLAPTLASAHTGVGDAHGVMHGFMHPVTGLDHILAMVTVGILAWQLGGRAAWALPSTFVALMALGSVFGAMGIGMPLVELGIALSVIVLGAAVALGIKAQLAVAMGLVGFFAIFHGHAHGVEMPENPGGLAYGLGFMLATALLHLAGLGIGFAIGRFSDTHGAVWIRAAGAFICLIGLGAVSGIL